MSTKNKKYEWYFIIRCYVTSSVPTIINKVGPFSVEAECREVIKEVRGWYGMNVAGPWRVEV